MTGDPSGPFAEVIGDPVAHSRSPAIHRHWLAAAGIDADYRPMRVEPGELMMYLDARRADPAWRGCNVTIPHKIAVMGGCDRIEPEAAAIGAVNTVWRAGDGALVGANTDAAGFAEPLAACPLNGRAALVIGAGGAARAVLASLAAAGVARCTVMARDRHAAQAMLARAELAGAVIGFDDPVPGTDLLVNASPLGMTGKPPLAIDLGRLPAGAIVYDLVYAPLETPLLAAARSRGLVAIDGLAMLIGQAALAFSRFFGTMPPRHDDDGLRTILTRP